MNGKKLAVISFFILFGGLAVASVASLAWVLSRVRAFEQAHGCDVLAGVAPAAPAAATNAPAAATNAAAAATNAASAAPEAGDGEAEAVTNAPPELKVVGIRFNNGNELDIQLSERPDMSVVRRYVTVGPMNEGVASFSLRSVSTWGGGREPHLVVCGDFAYRTNVTLRLLKGFPLEGRGETPGGKGSLAEDYTYAFTRKDGTPYVRYSDDGRYLPPVGRRWLALESMNVGSVLAEIRRVEPRNVVQLLAREEGVYQRMQWSSGVDNEETEELSGAVVSNAIACVNRLNAKESLRLPVAMADGGPSNGIYLVSVRDGGRPRRDWTCDDDGAGRNPCRYRVVCVSDLGITARRSGADGLGVWVTSLTTGRPVPGGWVEAYSSSNTRVMEGRTDANGWCEARRIAPGEPFALVVMSPDADDMSFLALRASTSVEELAPEGSRDAYLKPDEVKAFVWTDRGIYRHGETVFLHALLRDGTGRAPRPFPVEAVLADPEGNALTAALAPDAYGALAYARFIVPEDRPSGVWNLRLRVPGADGRVLGERSIRVEEFAPPQIRVRVTPDDTAPADEVRFAVSAEHLFGAPARGLPCEGAALLEDAPFAPADWKGWRFGDDDLGMRPNFQTKKGPALDDGGRCEFAFPVKPEFGRPKAAVKVTLQGVAFEDGGRPATVRTCFVRHTRPFYIGSTLADWVRLEPGSRVRVRFACVTPDGARASGARRLAAKLERIDSVYSYRKAANGWHTWDRELVRVTVAEGLSVEVPADGDGVLELSVPSCGDYALTAVDPETGVSFARTFYASDWGDDTVRAPLATPTKVSVVPDRGSYRPGETPRLAVKAPFAGHALLTVMREGVRYSEVIALTNATSEVVLRPVTEADAPNLEVALSVVQGVEADARHFAVRAHGFATVRVCPADREIAVAVRAKADFTGDSPQVVADIAAPGAERVAVTLVDEGVNLLTDEPVPDPTGFFAEPCTAFHPLHDLYGRILPVLDAEALRANGVKTGGGEGADLLRRVSPVPTRRFRPLARWQRAVPVVDGKARVTFDLPVFAGEVRVTAVAYGARATGAAAKLCKVTPRLVLLADAPRFVAPGDVFEASLALYNRADEDGAVGFSVEAGTQTVARCAALPLPRDGSTSVVVRVTAPAESGELALRFRARGLGEAHDSVIDLPVRPAVAWRETSGVARLPAGETGFTVPGEGGRGSWRAYDSPVAALAPALRWLADYPHGCLEQTASRLLPLVAAGGLLNGVGATIVTNGSEYAAACVRRIESMVRRHDFVMWPDCDSAPWDREVSVYAAHALAVAEKAGLPLAPRRRAQVKGFLSRWAMSTNDAVSVYACHVLALSGTPERDRMFRLYDGRARLGPLDRARLARAFAVVGDRPRAEALLASLPAPASVKDAAFAVLALMDLDPDDGRILPLVEYLHAQRDRERSCWGTTGENALALAAIGSYFRRRPPKEGERFAVWHRLRLPRPEEVADEANGIDVSRRYLTADGGPADLSRVSPGDLLVAELAVTVPETRTLSDLVVEDLLPGAFEPVHGALPPSCEVTGTNDLASADWVMRRDLRDDRALVYSRRFVLRPGERALFRYPVRAVTPGDYVLPGPRVEAMYFPQLRAERAPARLTVGRRGR